MKIFIHKDWHILCFLFGHKPDSTTDSGSLVCKRCFAHEYWDTKEYGSNKWENAGYLLIPLYWIMNKYRLIISNLKLRHKNELPF